MNVPGSGHPARRPPRYVAVVGPGATATAQDREDAYTAGARLAEQGIVVLTGGLGGVMAAAAQGAASVGGLSVGLLPTDRRDDGAAAHSVLLPTGLGELRNGLLVRCAEVVLAIGGSWGTVSEIALAVRTRVPVVTLRGWQLPEDGPQQVADIETAVAAVRRLLPTAGGDGVGGRVP